MNNQTIILQVQGGMGNQMIQYGYIQSLASILKERKVVVNPIMTSKLWAKARGVSHRPHSKLLKNHFPIIKSKRVQISDWVLSKLPPEGHEILTDKQQEISGDAHVVHCSGYFQKAKAFSTESQPVWGSILNSIREINPKSRELYPKGKVALHHRLGDYLWTENQQLFAQISLKERVQKALNWRETLGSNKPIAIYTDSPHLLQEQMREKLSATESNECIITANSSALEDFIQLTRHRHMVTGCSTFSLCAGRVSWERQKRENPNNNAPTVKLPLRWYRDEMINEDMMKEMERCMFTSAGRE